MVSGTQARAQHPPVICAALCLLLGCSSGGPSPSPSPSPSPAPTPYLAFGWQEDIGDSPDGLLMAVWGSAPDDVWLVGGHPEAGLVLRGRAGQWAPMALPEGAPLLNWVHGLGPEHVWVGGLGGALYLWDGAAWHDHSVDVDEAIWGVFAASETEAVAVGGGGRYGGDGAVAFEWDGAQWSPLTLPEAAAGSPGLFKVSKGLGGYWIVGAQGLALRGSPDALAVAPTGTAQDLVTVHADAAGQILVVGGRATGVVLGPQGDGLSVAVEAPAGLSGVYAEGDGAVVAGERGFTAYYDRSNDALAAEPIPTSHSFHGAWSDGEGAVYLVGGNLAAIDDYVGMLYVGHWPGRLP